MPEIVFDNCVLSNFALSGSLDIAKKLYADNLYVTNFVVAENMKGIFKGYLPLTKIKDVLDDGWLKEITLKSKKEKDLFETLSLSLGMGESSSIAVAKIRHFTFASDDMVARREAELLGIKLTGTIGILMKAAKKRITSYKEADKILIKMVRNGFYSPIRSISEII